MNASFGQGSTFKSVAEQILAHMDKKNKEYVMGSPDRITGLCSTFSGSDICGFFDGELGELMSCTIRKRTMEAIFALGETAKNLIFCDREIKFHLIGVNEQGDKSLISGVCTPFDFEIVTSIDELNIEAKIYFDSKITDIRGFLHKSQKDNDYIGELFYKLRMERFIANGGNPQNVMYKEYLNYLEVKKNAN